MAPKRAGGGEMNEKNSYIYNTLLRGVYVVATYDRVVADVYEKLD